ncbi:nuclear transport factor 2 family protein [Olivibacter sp. XZL3]|uniref:nuclear transport factor 2 family protein n=1 Tax=Olivibacter sp. XZL3 TaxID=1735116 RepID=UPI00106712C6|nr:nuclear transport factor 2 family protein [Olivibacter sp. XZL3]
MKTSIKLFIVAIILFSSSAFASATEDRNLSTAENAIHEYIDGITLGRTENIEALFAESFKRNTAGNGAVYSHSKKQVVDFLKQNRNLKQNCITQYDVIEQSAQFALAKLEMRYPEFTKIEYVQLCREGSEWKINQVTTTYKQ